MRLWKWWSDGLPLNRTGKIKMTVIVALHLFLFAIPIWMSLTLKKWQPIVLEPLVLWSFIQCIVFGFMPPRLLEVYKRQEELKEKVTKSEAIRIDS
jgi:hypothetical protein